MTTSGVGSSTWAVETSRSCEVNEQHLFDENPPTERAFCDAASSTGERVSVGYYMEQRKNGHEVGSVCESCKAFAPPFALRLSRDLEAGGMLDEAEEYRRLAGTLRRETGQAGMTTSREADLENAGRQGMPAQAHGT